MLLIQARRILGLLSGRQRPLAVGWVVLTALSALTDAVGIAALYGTIDLALGNTENQWVERVRNFTGLDTDSLFVMLCVTVAAVYLFKFVATLTTTFVIERMTWSLYGTLAQRLFQFYLSRPYAFHLRTNSNDLVYNIISALTNVARTGVTHWLTLVADAIHFVFIIVMLLVIQPGVTAAALAVLGVLAGALLIYGRSRVLRWGGEVANSHNQIYRCAQEAFSVVKEIKLYGREGHFVSTLKGALGRLSSASLKNSMLMQLPKPLLETIVVLVIASLLAYAHLGTPDAAALISMLVLFGAAAQRLMPAALRALNAIQYIRFIDPYVTRIHADVTAAQLLPPPSFKPACAPEGFERIVFENADFTYEGAPRKALNGLSLTIERGQVIGIVGPSGGGKSTLVDVLLGLLKLDSGTVRVEASGKRLDPAECTGLFGYVPQAIYLIDATIRSNVALGCDCEDDSRLHELVEMCQLREFITEQAHGIETHVGERGVRLSGGQRQRIAWARAMFHDPEILVLDEATAALDTLTEAAITEAIESLRGGKTLIIVAHRLSTVKNCDYLVVMDQGKVQAVGGFEDLERTSPLFRDMVDHMRQDGQSQEAFDASLAQEVQ